MAYCVSASLSWNGITEALNSLNFQFQDSEIQKSTARMNMLFLIHSMKNSGVPQYTYKQP